MSSWWPVGTQLECGLTVGGRLLVGVFRHSPTTFPLQFITVCTRALKFVPILSQINPAQALVNYFYFMFWTVTSIL